MVPLSGAERGADGGARAAAVMSMLRTVGEGDWRKLQAGGAGASSALSEVVAPILVSSNSAGWWPRPPQDSSLRRCVLLDNDVKRELSTEIPNPCAGRAIAVEDTTRRLC